MTGTEPMDARHRYVPALGIRALTRFYDVVLRATMREHAFKTELIRHAHLRPGHRVLDLGCGTATLSIMIKELYPEAGVVGLDGDPEVLGLARAKAMAAGVSIELHRGLSFEPPFEPKSFDRVISSLLFHHLTLDHKRRTLRAARILLTSRGELHIADWGRPANGAMRAASWSIRLLDGFENTRDNLLGRLPALMSEAGFIHVEETRRRATPFGTLAFYQGASP